MDIHSGTMDNSVGKKLRIDPWQVEANRDVTCAKGLHVCSRSYLPHFGGSGSRVVICKVNPADVVAVPNDYNNAKMRVCAYEVIGELNDVQKAAIFDQQRVLNTAAAPYVSWSEDYSPDEEEPDECDDCGFYEDDCECSAPEETPHVFDTATNGVAEEPAPTPKKKSWFNWGGN